MMQRLGEFFAHIARRWLPDPLALACMLTILVFAIAWFSPQAGSLRDEGFAARSVILADMWLQAVWNPRFLTFALQMCVVLLTGFGLARAPTVLRGLRAVASLASGNRSAVLLVGLASCLGCWINWGFGLVLAGVLATEVRASLARKGVACQYALMVAAAYAGMMIWHGGFSGSAPLKAASDGVVIEALDDAARVERIAPIPVTKTVLAPANLALSAVLIVGVPLALRAMARSKVTGDVAVVSGDDGGHAPEPVGSPAAVPKGPAARVNQSRLLPSMIAVMALLALGYSMRTNGTRAIDLNFVNSVFLALGLLLHRDLASYVDALLAGGRAIVGIVVQFPLYSGIQGIMFGAGLAAAVSHGFVDAAQQTAELLGVGVRHTFPLATFLSAAVVNFFVPSGGGQWIVQGPIMCGAANALAVPYNQTVMAIAYGDQLTNMVQPFWAIPLMGITRVNAQVFMGYCALLMLLALPVFAAALLLY